MSIASLLLIFLIFELVRSRRLRERYALLWLLTGIVLLVLSAWRQGLNTIAGWVGVSQPVALLFAVAGMFVILVLLHYSTVISKLADQNTVLAQRLALLEQELGEREASENSAAEPPAQRPLGRPCLPAQRAPVPLAVHVVFRERVQVALRVSHDDVVEALAVDEAALPELHHEHRGRQVVAAVFAPVEVELLEPRAQGAVHDLRVVERDHALAVQRGETEPRVAHRRGVGVLTVDEAQVRTERQRRWSDSSVEASKVASLSRSAPGRRRSSASIRCVLFAWYS